MKKIILLLPVLLTLALPAFCRADITFKVEELSKPQKTLPEISQKEIFEKLIRSDAGINPWLPPLPSKTDADLADFPYNIVVQSKSPSKLVDFGYYSFLQVIYMAYAEHRPFGLSPDMIWLLISQGFARHVNANSEKLRSRFADYSGKISLVVTSTEVRLDNPNAPWETIFPRFTQQIAKNAGGNLTETLSANFSTTTPVEKVASDITIMEAMKSYFEYILPSPLCGIPEITLQGTPEDWQKVLDKTKQLEKYDLAWWTNELEPILKEFVRASHGEIDESFWKDMVKYHVAGMCGEPGKIDGWIVKFFPYDKDGNRNNLKEIKVDEMEGAASLPSEIVKVDLSYIDLAAKTTTPLELWAGFVGLEQDSKNYALTPKIGWMIRKADTENIALNKSIDADVNGGMLRIRVKEVTPEILAIKKIDYLSITFLDKIIIPDRMAEMRVGTLDLDGKIDEAGIKRIKAMFPKTTLYINGKKI